MFFIDIWIYPRSKSMRQVELQCQLYFSPSRRKKAKTQVSLGIGLNLQSDHPAVQQNGKSAELEISGTEFDLGTKKITLIISVENWKNSTSGSFNRKQEVFIRSDKEMPQRELIFSQRIWDVWRNQWWTVKRCEVWSWHRLLWSFSLWRLEHLLRSNHNRIRPCP